MSESSSPESLVASQRLNFKVFVIHRVLGVKTLSSNIKLRKKVSRLPISAAKRSDGSYDATAIHVPGFKIETKTTDNLNTTGIPLRVVLNLARAPGPVPPTREHAVRIPCPLSAGRHPSMTETIFPASRRNAAS